MDSQAQTPRQRLTALITENHDLQMVEDRDPQLQARLRALQAWQCQRLLTTHADLAADARYGPGVRFFVDDLYAPKDFSGRDADIERAVPAMVRLLPDSVLNTAADGAWLYVLSRRLDRDMTHALFDTLGVTAIDDDAYAEAYRICDDYHRRAEQIDIIHQLADRLDRYVRSRFIYATLKMTRVPAQMAGLGELQDFLERGFSAFHHMRGSAEFVNAITGRERAILERIFAGDPRPFDLPS